ncbi:MAG: YcxB family protein [Paludisphaera borealis]|uniref:YcxB family protein n=1 Tax=Paludisphaera borealis TaxID=1387353 RepID=UPI00283C5D9E|nr:YcxB family protein [Paludisphaera borealis]MDR3619339.1 YcxB family protein [Paludisphaera borealis]
MESVESTPGVLGSVSFLFTEQEFIAAYRAVRMAENRSYDSFISRLGVIVLGYVFLLGGIMVTIMWLLGMEGGNGPIPPLAALFNIAIAGVAGWALYSRIHGYRRRLKSMYRKLPIQGEKVHYQFTPLRIITEGKLAQGSVDWSVINRVLEFRDGFLLYWGTGSAGWIPNHALSDTFGVDDLAELFRAKVKKFVVIDRLAGLPEASKSRPNQA